MKERLNLTDGDKKLLQDVQEYGWHVIKVLEDEDGPGFGYSVGFFHTFNHPEVIIIGLNLDLIQSIINGIGDEISKGKKFEAKQFYPDLIDDFNCYFIDVEKQFYKSYVGYALWYYQNDSFPLLQCIYPATKGIYPWQIEWPESIKDLQPILGDIDKGNLSSQR